MTGLYPTFTSRVACWPKTLLNISESKESIDEIDDYSYEVIKLSSESKAKASERLKTEEELALETKQKLEELFFCNIINIIFKTEI